jgi:hypothetical protein
LYFNISEHAQSKLHRNNLIFGDYSLVLEFNISINISLIDPIEFYIFDLDERMLITENLKYAEHHEFVDTYEQITSNKQLITTNNTRNIELMQEYFSSQFAQELYVTPREQIHHLPMDSIPIVYNSSHDFIDFIGEALELSFVQCFHPTINYYISSHHAEYVKFEPR